MRRTTAPTVRLVQPALQRAGRRQRFPLAPTRGREVRAARNGDNGVVHSSARQEREPKTQLCDCGRPLRVFPLLPGPAHAIASRRQRLVGPRSTPPERGPFRCLATPPDRLASARRALARYSRIHACRYSRSPPGTSIRVRARIDIVEQFLTRGSARYPVPAGNQGQRRRLPRRDVPQARLRPHRPPRPAHAPRRRDHQPAADARGGAARLAGQWRGAPHRRAARMRHPARERLCPGRRRHARPRPSIPSSARSSTSSSG